MATTGETEQRPATARFDASIIDTTIRIGVLGLLAYWSLRIIGPFLNIALWSAILTVALYQSFSRLAGWLGNRRRLAAALITLLCLLIVIGPVTWLGLGLVGGAEFVIDRLESNVPLIPLPPEWLKTWPLIGERLHQLWTLAATDIRATLVDLAPSLKPLAGKLLNVVGSVGFGLVELAVSIIIAGFMFAPGPQLAKGIGGLLHRVFGQRSDEMLNITAGTIRNVSRGVLGVALIQSFFAGIGFLLAGLPAAGILSAIVLVLGIIQIGPAILLIPMIVWSWTAMDTTSALLFTAYMVPVGLVDNILRPILMARGLSTPMPIILIGVIGGTITYGISGLFLGPIVLSVVWALVVAGVQDDADKQESDAG